MTSHLTCCSCIRISLVGVSRVGARVGDKGLYPHASQPRDDQLRNALTALGVASETADPDLAALETTLTSRRAKKLERRRNLYFTNPRSVSTSVVKKSVLANNDRWVRMKTGHVVVRLRSGAEQPSGEFAELLLTRVTTVVARSHEVGLVSSWRTDLQSFGGARSRN